MDESAGLIQWFKSSTQRGRIYADTSGATPQLWVEAGDAPAANSARLMLYAKSPASSQTGVRIESSGGAAASITLRIDGSSHVITDTDWMEFQTGVMSGLRPDVDEQGYCGSGDQGWYEVASKQFTDIGCLSWCDEGVELTTGEIVSDVEALMRIQPMSDGTRALSGMRKLDYSTLPAIVYRPVYNDDGSLKKGCAELTSLISVMIGAVRELTRDVRTLQEAR